MCLVDLTPPSSLRKHIVPTGCGLSSYCQSVSVSIKWVCVKVSLCCVLQPMCRLSYNNVCLMHDTSCIMTIDFRILFCNFGICVSHSFLTFHISMHTHTCFIIVSHTVYRYHRLLSHSTPHASYNIITSTLRIHANVL